MERGGPASQTMNDIRARDLGGFCLFGNTHTYTQMKIKTVYPHSWKQHKKQSYEKAAGLEAAELMADACITKGHKKDSHSSL